MGKHSRSLALVSAGLVAGLTLGPVGVANAATPLAAAELPANSVRMPASPASDVWPELDRSDSRRHGLDPLAHVVAGLTGTEAADVMTARLSGKSFAAVARANGVPAEAVVSAATSRASAELAAAVRAGRLDPSDGRRLLTGLRSRFMLQVDDGARPRA